MIGLAGMWIAANLLYFLWTDLFQHDPNHRHQQNSDKIACATNNAKNSDKMIGNLCIIHVWLVIYFYQTKHPSPILEFSDWWIWKGFTLEAILVVNSYTGVGGEWSWRILRPTKVPIGMERYKTPFVQYALGISFIWTR